ncbi:MAG TPA: hypothetical protein VFV94_20800, partial [Polyangiaceae bacterium]|nr:hypothetical protein [Polyangiaceae bacterium]
MNFVRSRVALVGLVLAWPFSQLVGCTATERQYDPESGEGGESATGGSASGLGGTNGGSSGAKGGAGGTKGGSSGSSAGGDSGSGGESGGGGDSTSGKGGASKGGSSGTTGGTDTAGAGTSDAGAAGAFVDPGCVATGAEVCDDGLDNDCDGTTDCLVPTTAFPLLNGAAAGTDVAYGFEVPADGAKFQCRVTHGDTPSGSFRPCAGGVDETSTERVVHPFDLAAASD